MRAFCAGLLALCLASCSTVRLAYDNAATYIHSRATDYLELDGAMAEELDAAIASFMSWHRANALPNTPQFLTTPAGVSLGDSVQRTLFGVTMP